MCYWNTNIFFPATQWIILHIPLFLFLVEIFVTQPRSTPPPKPNSWCSMQLAWGDDSRFFGGWWRGTFEISCRFSKGTSVDTFFSSQRDPCRMHWRTKGHHNVVDICAANCCRFRQPYVQLRSFYSATYGTIIIEFFIIIDLTCIVLFAFAGLIQTDRD